MRRSHAAKISSLACLALLAAGGAASADPVAVRAALHDGFGRIAFDWPAPVGYETHLDNMTLAIKFGRPLEGNFAGLAATLGPYVANAALDADKTTLTLHLKRAVSVEAFTIRGSTVAVDLKPAEAAPAKPAAAPAKPAAAPQKAAAKPVIPEGVRLTTARHGSGQRITFAWPRPVPYDLTIKDGMAVLAFNAVGRIDDVTLAAMLPALTPKVEQQGALTTVFLTIPAGVRVTPSRVGRAILLDIAGKPTPPVAPPPPAKAQIAKAPDAAPPVAPTAAAPPASAPPEPVAQAAPQPAPIAQTPPPAPPPPPANLAVGFAAGDGSASLRFDWPMTTGAAVFRRGMAVWIVFAAPTTLDLTEPREHGQPALNTIAQLPDKTATVVRLVPHDGLEPSVRRTGTSWIVDLKPQALHPDAPIAAESHPSASPASVTYGVHHASTAVQLHDPEIGDRLLAIPVEELGRGVDSPQELVEYRGLPSVQGIVLRPLADDLTVHIEDASVVVTRPGGLALSSDRDRLLGRALQRTHALFDFAAWGGPKDSDFAEQRSRLERAIADAPQGARSQPRLALAQFYFSHFFAAETIAVLEAIGRDDPALAGDPRLRALKGAACLLAGNLKCAGDELGQPSLDKDPEAALWRASLAAENSDWEHAAEGFVDNAALLGTYPKELRARFALQAARAMLETDRASVAAPLLDLVLKGKPERADEAMALYLDGRRLQQQGHLDDALARWEKVAGMGDLAAQVRAQYSTALALYDAGKANAADTVKALDTLRFAWRGDDFEFALLRRLGELKIAQGDQSGGLEALQQASTYFPDNPAAKDVVKETSDAFAAVFLGDQSGDTPPLKALALYDGFHDLEPVGPRRDSILRKLIDRLVAVDLLDRAAGLLEDFATKRLTGLDKMRATTQLALLRLMDHKPDAAQKALDIDVGPDLPADLLRQRQQLRARVQMDLGRPTDALAILASDTSRDADRLRADIYWRGHNWKEAANTLGRLLGPPPADGKVDAETGHLVVSLAAALTLDDDQAGLAKLRASYGDAMNGSSFAQAFRVLAADTAGDPPVGDPLARASRVAQLGDLQSFMAAYKQRLAGTKLSAIN